MLAKTTSTSDLSTYNSKTYFRQNLLGLQTAKSRRAIEKVDLLLLAIEAIDINASQTLAFASRNLQLDKTFPNYVEIWKSRCHNPMRKSTRNAPITKESFDALVVLLSNMAEKFHPQIRELLSINSNQFDYNNRWSSFSSRLDQLINERMNVRRGAVKKYLSYSADSNSFHKKLLFTLALSSGKGGLERLSSSIFEPLSQRL
ncbi:MULTISPECIES: DUF3038 domain-containing protein [Prochlorococcus]|uniref:Uncharacterized protein n=1 Tax=Prochlorococcus marinus (strain SARG / CCMP1375 / SS120) TaxID=167539 RepID=Q7VC34_PROMA|nr:MULTISPECIES: DUF3038 domain-containing protein [Prochlorococcus]KGG11703.1 hypothetical protein EV04_0727 [Prochlorococcus marinus str. LG]KGG18883.1 hypothetical protein EV08_1370 [Prochlorococcus marinus str. SS2]KGG23579.1 hypothetical protein EV09_1203 [Prochlorococcus marinus str. SS35]AAP99952.1 Uncharacterized protein Pro_0908 [Prochlorococcus marinus subsp. marinus str. CCMP1375]KGG32185.1 hypothetical protein EV10_1300 [Prochlorococcus marinus str. SS51]